jgi:hypothetical protein
MYSNQHTQREKQQNVIIVYVHCMIMKIWFNEKHKSENEKKRK